MGLITTSIKNISYIAQNDIKREINVKFDRAIRLIKRDQWKRGVKKK